MKEVLVLDHTDVNSKELRAKRLVTVRIADGKPLTIDHIMIAHRGIPVWIAKVDAFTVAGGPFPKDVKISLGEVALLEQSWNEVASVISGVNINHGTIVNLNVLQLFSLGESFTKADVSPGTLTAEDAALRLAWTYGVSKDNVKITIEF